MKSLVDFINEGLFSGITDAFAVRKQITELQGRVEEEYEKELEANPKRYRNGKQLLDSVKSKAYSLYNEIVTLKDKAISFNEWWRNYEKANARFLDMTIFNIE